MVPFHNHKEYLFNLYTTSNSDAKRLWRKHIKESWENKCAYCGSEDNLTLDHIIPRSKGGEDSTNNVICCCHSCNQSKGHNSWEEWYSSQEFFNEIKYQKILNWIKPDEIKNLFCYRKTRKNYIFNSSYI